MLHGSPSFVQLDGYINHAVANRLSQLARPMAGHGVSIQTCERGGVPKRVLPPKQAPRCNPMKLWFLNILRGLLTCIFPNTVGLLANFEIAPSGSDGRAAKKLHALLYRKCT